MMHLEAKEPDTALGIWEKPKTELKEPILTKL